MNYQYSMSPYIQAAMAQAMQAIMSGGPLPSNCIIVTIPFQQAQQMFPQLMLNYASGGSAGGSVISQPQSYYGQGYQPQISPYQYNQPSNALMPYSNLYAQNYNPNYNYPVVPYGGSHTKSKKKNRRNKQTPLQPHSNVYNSSSFDTDMNNLSWSRLFGTHHPPRRHSKQASKDQGALSYDQKSKRRTQSAGSSSSSSSGSSSTTTSDETIRRVNVSNKPPAVPTTSSLKQQTKSSLPFKYSSEFIPGIGKQQQQQQSQKSNKKEVKLKSDDVFVVKKSPPPPPPPPSSSSSQQQQQ